MQPPSVRACRDGKAWLDKQEQRASEEQQDDGPDPKHRTEGVFVETPIHEKGIQTPLTPVPANMMPNAKPFRATNHSSRKRIVGLYTLSHQLRTKRLELGLDAKHELTRRIC